MLYNTRLIWIFQIHCAFLTVERIQKWYQIKTLVNAYCIKCKGAGSAVACLFSALICGRDTLEILSKTRIVWVSFQVFSLNILFWIVNVVLWFIDFFVFSNEKNWLLHLRTVILFWNQDHYSMSIFLSQVFISIKIKKRGKLYTKINVNDQKFPNADARATKWK